MGMRVADHAEGTGGGQSARRPDDAPPMRTALELMAAGRFGAAEIFVERNRHRVDAQTRSQWIEALIGYRRGLGPDEDTGPIDRLGEAILRCGWERR
jgi:hypothetical protein